MIGRETLFGAGAVKAWPGGHAILATVALLLVLLPACAPRTPVRGTRVVTTSNIVADWVRRVGKLDDRVLFIDRIHEVASSADPRNCAINRGRSLSPHPT